MAKCYEIMVYRRYDERGEGAEDIQYEADTLGRALYIAKKATKRPDTMSAEVSSMDGIDIAVCEGGTCTLAYDLKRTLSTPLRVAKKRARKKVAKKRAKKRSLSGRSRRSRRRGLL